ncbi:MAG: phosphotransferase [Tateyamaria sp.]|uniref:phosphotransferase n=1 Tax=Tateyamaria sp. TaxID=1929288 RepID=UPI003273C20A
MLGKDPRLKLALAEWAEIAPQLGLVGADFKSKVIWQKDEPERSHIVVRLKGKRKLILKRIFKAPDDSDHLGTVQAQQGVFERLAEQQKAHAPEVLYCNDDGTLVIMVEASGKTLNDHLAAGRPHAQMLRRSGTWLAAFHKTMPTEKRTYQPKYMVAHVSRMGDAVLEGALNVPLPDLFIASCAKIPQIAETVSDQQTTSAVKHGDFNLRNILLGPDGETGLDFKTTSTAPVGFDIARLLLDYAEMFQSKTDLQPGAVLSDATRDSFFDGYDLVGRDDPSVRFVPFVQLLNDWRLIPTNPMLRSWRQVARMEAIEALARNAFGFT